MSTPKEAFAELLRLHDLAVKAHVKYQAATPGTNTKVILSHQADKADDKFVAALARLFDQPIPVRK